jgi:hypothetical protein
MEQVINDRFSSGALALFAMCLKKIISSNSKFFPAQAGRLGVRFPMRSLDFSIDLVLPASLWTWG